MTLKIHRSFKEPTSIRIKKRNGKYSVSFCYEDGLDESDLLSQKDHLKYLKKASRKDLEDQTIGIDLGVKIPAYAGDNIFDFSKEQIVLCNLK
ncbi:MAG: hypothetical protein K1060chlam3_00482 [Candidatus Anoxychlamydiales bacterium]|nr:hypothetical protein [Candidatus Anoxychlamydiales bacterium]